MENLNHLHPIEPTPEAIHAGELADALNNEELAYSVAGNCNDPSHDERYCSRCAARSDGIDDYRDALRALLAKIDAAKNKRR